MRNDGGVGRVRWFREFVVVENSVDVGSEKRKEELISLVFDVNVVKGVENIGGELIGDGSLKLFWEFCVVEEVYGKLGENVDVVIKMFFEIVVVGIIEEIDSGVVVG